MYYFPLVLVGSLKKDQNMLAKNVEGLRRAIDDAVIKVKVQVNLNVCYSLRELCVLNIPRPCPLICMAL